MKISATDERTRANKHRFTAHDKRLRCPVVHHIAAKFVRLPAAVRRAELLPNAMVFAKLQVIDIAEFIIGPAKTPWPHLLLPVAFL